MVRVASVVIGCLASAEAFTIVPHAAPRAQMARCAEPQANLVLGTAVTGVVAGLLLNAQRGARLALNTPGGVMASVKLRDGSWTPSPPSMSCGGNRNWTPSPDLTSLRE